MTLRRSDYDQAARYLQRACEIMDSQAPGKIRATLEVLHLAIRRLSPGDHFVGDAAAEITVLRHAADQMPVADARTEILKAVAVLRDRSGR
jgi:limonene-1,2-epoxide hydrolase